MRTGFQDLRADAVAFMAEDDAAVLPEVEIVEGSRVGVRMGTDGANTTGRGSWTLERKP